MRRGCDITTPRTYTQCMFLAGHKLNNFMLDTLGIEPRAFRMPSGCDTTTPRTYTYIQNANLCKYFVVSAGTCVQIVFIQTSRISIFETSNVRDVTWLQIPFIVWQGFAIRQLCTSVRARSARLCRQWCVLRFAPRVWDVAKPALRTYTHVHYGYAGDWTQGFPHATRM